MLKTIAYVILVFACSPVFAQFENVWAFGKGAGLDFNSGHPIPIATSMDGYEGCASVCDAAGNLLFYTNSIKVWDRQHRMMPEGYNLPIGYSTAQGVLILPMPDSVNKYYIFSLTEWERGGYWGGRLYYTVVNMDLNNGFGDVEPGRKGILVDTGLSERMVTVSGNDCNVWLLVHKRFAQYKAYEIRGGHINTSPVVSNTGVFAGPEPYWFTGMIKVNAARNKIVATVTNQETENGIELSDFDPATGVVSNSIRINDTSKYYGACFSPDGSKLYAAQPIGHVIQYDLSSSDPAAINASRFQVLTSGRAPGIGAEARAISDMKLGPDDKIYFSNATDRRFLDAITLPNVAGAGCQVATKAVDLQVLDGITATLGLPNTITDFIPPDTITSRTYKPACFKGDTAIINAPEGYTRYVWNDGSHNPTLVIRQPGRYWVSYQNSRCAINIDTFDVERYWVTFRTCFESLVCHKDSNGLIWVVPGDTSTYQYTWSNGQGTVVREATNQGFGDTLRNLSSGTYTLNIRTFDCDTSIVFVIPDRTPSFIVDSTACTGATVSFANTSTGYGAFTWSFGDGDSSTDEHPVHQYDLPGIYQVTLTTQPCEDVMIQHIIVDPVPAVAAGADTIICFADRIVLQPIVSPSYTNYTYSWSPTGSLLHEDGSAANPVFTGYKNQTLSLSVSTPNGCSGQDDINIVVRPQHFMSITPADTSLCEPDTVQIHIMGDAINFRWSSHIGISDTSTMNPVVYTQSSMSYQVKGTDKYGCTDSQVVKINYHPKAMVEIADSAIVYRGVPYYMSSQGNCLYFAWYPSNGLSADNIADPMVMPEVNTRYYVQGTTEWGCSSTDSIDVLVSTDSYLDVPNAFTPGGGANNTLTIIQRGVVSLKSFRIFNRWGKKLFETTDIAAGWDGTFNGIAQPTGVYVYVIEAVIDNSYVRKFQGNVTLLR